MYRYGTTARPPVPGAVPRKGLFQVECFDRRTRVGDHRIWGTADYCVKLDELAVRQYKLVYLGEVEDV